MSYGEIAIALCSHINYLSAKNPRSFYDMFGKCNLVFANPLPLLHSIKLPKSFIFIFTESTNNLLVKHELALCKQIKQVYVHSSSCLESFYLKKKYLKTLCSKISYCKEFLSLHYTIFISINKQSNARCSNVSSSCQIISN